MSRILVVNAGSSSFKYQLIEMDNERVLVKGLVERIGESTGRATHTSIAENGSSSSEHVLEAPVPDHRAGFALMMQAFGKYGPELPDGPAAVGHRIVHGGDLFTAATLIDERVKEQIDELSELAPLHNPAALQGIRAAESTFPGVPQVAIFDTAFHRTLPPAAFTYAIETDLAERYRLRRYGFHGSSHKFVSEAAAQFLGIPLAESKIIVLHLGNGASACAVDGGRSVETSMGLSPLEGLVMGTRSGDVDPAVLFQLHRVAGTSPEDLELLLNRKSGMLGLAGSGDMRDVEASAASGNQRAELALEVYAHRLRHYVGAYLAQLGRVDAVVFTAGVGENSPDARGRALRGMEGLGIAVDPARNLMRSGEARSISPAGAAVSVLVVPTNEELEIARQTVAVTGGR